MVLPERKPNRLNGYDYSRPGMYFITICVKDRIESFGNIRDGRMEINEYGEIVQQQWRWLENQYNHIELDSFVIMPNHVHGIICIVDVNNAPVGNGPITAGNDHVAVNGSDVVGNGRDRSLRRKADLRKIKPLPEIVGAFKTTSSKMIHRAGLESFRWQKSYYDHIIRDNLSLYNIRRYIINNPLKWKMDTLNRNVCLCGDAARKDGNL